MISPRPERYDRGLLEHEITTAGSTIRANACTCPNPVHDDANASGSIFTDDHGVFRVKCHGCGFRGDVFDLRYINTGVTVAEQLKQAPATSNGNGRAMPAKKPRPAKLHPTPECAAEAAAWLVQQQQGDAWTPGGIWPYRRNGNEYARVLRFDAPDGSNKTFRPIYRDGDGWRVGDPAMWFPYGMDDMPADEVVWVVEGEKTADALRTVGIMAITSAHGSKAPHKTDWSALAGREVLVWPDRDKAGLSYAKAVATILAKLDPPATVRIITPPHELPEGSDAADYIEARESIEPDEIRKGIEALANRAEPITSPSPTPRQGPRLIRMSEVEPTDVRWLWPGRIPLGRLTLLVGRPGDGKSLLTAYVAANVSRGRNWIDGSPCPTGSVVLCSAEDDPADTIAPRLIAHDANRKRVHLLAGVMSRNGVGEEVERVFTLANLPALRQTLEQLADCKLIVVDPIGSYLGGEADAHRDNEVRAVLAPVCHLAALHGAAVVVVAHTRKAIAANADDMAMGSRAFTGLARSVLHLVIDPDDTTQRRRLLLPGKSNLANRPPGLAFEIRPGDIHDWPCVQWLEGEVTITADEAVNREPQHDNARRTERDEAADWLREVLTDAPRPAKELIEEARESKGIAEKTLRRAMKGVGVKAYRPKNPGAWWWRLPDSGAHGHTPNGESDGHLAICSGAIKNGDSRVDPIYVGSRWPHGQPVTMCSLPDSAGWVEEGEL